MRLIIREADKFGGNGWLSYHAVFHCNHVPCRHCHNIDHVSTECTVTAVLQGTRDGTSAFLLHTITQDRSGLKGEQPLPYSQQCPICTSCNAGTCKFPGRCTYAHVCVQCHGSHPAIACRDWPYPTPAAPANQAASKAQHD